MPRVAPSELGDSTADRVMGHRPELLEAWENLKHALLGPSSTLSPQLKEEVRRTLAQRTGCQFCASLGLPADDHATRSESLAVAFADAVALDHTAISEAQVKVLLDEFSVPQVVELLMWISFEYAGQMFGCLIGDEPATAEEKDAFADSIAQLCPAPPPSAAASPSARR
jgi:alkylhydroperoxidase family enzyme